MVGYRGDLRIEQARSLVEVEDACERPLRLLELGEAVSASVGRVVPHDGYCLFGFDPLSGLVSFHTSRNGYRDVLRDCARLAENEQLEDDLHRFSDLAGTPVPVGLLGSDSRAERTSARRHEIMPAGGYGAELRLALVSGRRLWGGLVLLRERRRPPFNAADASFAAGLGRTLARTVRRLPVVEPWPHDAAADPPGVILLGPGNAVEVVSPEARRWLARIETGAGENGAAGLPPAVYSVASAARRAAVDPTAPDPVSRAPSVEGRWVVLHGSLLDGDPDGRACVVLEAGGPRTVFDALAAWYGLTGREREVVVLVLDGRPAKQIARRLGLSLYTVHDHLKAIFRKVGVSGSHELVAAFAG